MANLYYFIVDEKDLAIAAVKFDHEQQKCVLATPKIADLLLGAKKETVRAVCESHKWRLLTPKELPK